MSRRPRINEDTESSGFLRRWSRRKARVGSDQPPENGHGEPAPEAVAEPEGTDARLEHSEGPPVEGEVAAEPGQEARVKTDEDMQDLDTIDETTDMSGFFSPGVSEALRNQALRRLFRLPRFNVTDGLDDYDQDYRNFETLGDIVTSDMRHRTEMEQQRQQAANAQDGDLQPDTDAVEQAGAEGEEAPPAEQVDSREPPGEAEGSADPDTANPGVDDGRESSAGVKT